jgi:AraC family transcriptional regulator of adaptative response / DNA-3-methyladenine glycosylase II
MLGEGVVPEVEMRRDGGYGRSVSIDGRTGVVIAEDAAPPAGRADRDAKTHLVVRVSSSLLPVLMPLLARLRHLFDLDAEPRVVDAHLSRSGLGALVRRHPGLRIPGALDGFEVAMRTILGAGSRAGRGELIQRIAVALGEPLDTGIPGLSRLMPGAERIVEAGVPALVALGVPGRRAEALVGLARTVAAGTLRLEPGQDVATTQDVLLQLQGVGERVADAIVTRALHWPDAFPASDRQLQQAAGVPNARALRTLAEDWRPWRAYAALHLRLNGGLRRGGRSS